MLRNDDQGYGAVSQTIHWVMAVIIIALFALGLWMTSLTYYDVWYTRGPYIHEGIGVFTAALLIFRLYWRITNPKPDESHLNPFERIASLCAHWSLYGLLFIIMASGYLISTADGRPVNVFDWFHLPALIQSKGLEEQAGAVHLYFSIVMIGVVVLHTLAALKHHFIDKDPTLVRMLPVKSDAHPVGENSGEET